jgi:hypothetical protein
VALPSIREVWTFLRKAEELLALHKKVETSLELIDGRLRALEDRVLRLETGQGQIFTEARNAATLMASGVISDAITRITRLEVHVQQSEARRLAP